MYKRPLRLFFGIWIFLVSLTALLVWVWAKQTPLEARFHEEQKLSKQLLLTDFCFSTESRHTRHLSMPEWIAPFQDLPAFHDHFPSSSFFTPQLQSKENLKSN